MILKLNHKSLTKLLAPRFWWSSLRLTPEFEKSSQSLTVMEDYIDSALSYSIKPSVCRNGIEYISVAIGMVRVEQV